MYNRLPCSYIKEAEYKLRRQKCTTDCPALTSKNNLKIICYLK